MRVLNCGHGAILVGSATHWSADVPLNRMLMVGNNHEQDFVSLLGTLEGIAESQ